MYRKYLCNISEQFMCYFWHFAFEKKKITFQSRHTTEKLNTKKKKWLHEFIWRLLQKHNDES